jgi:flagellar basal body-associated protein FliL
MTNSTDELVINQRSFSSGAIITIIVFVFVALVLVSIAVYLLVKGKNISEVFEETVEDGDCLQCIPLSNESQHSANSEVNNSICCRKFNVFQDFLKYHQRHVGALPTPKVSNTLAE